MYESHLTVVGTVITDPIKRSTPTGDTVLSFRIASNARRFDRDLGDWVDAGTLYATVSCWRRLVSGVGFSLMKGDPVIVHGIARTNEYVTREGTSRADLELRATAVGPDLARCVATVDRVKPRTDAEVVAGDIAGSESVPRAGSGTALEDSLEGAGQDTSDDSDLAGAELDEVGAGV